MKSKPTYQQRVAEALRGERGPAHFVDPGVTGTGYASWLELPLGRPTRPDDSGCVKGIKRSESWEDRAYYVARTLMMNVFEENGARLVVVELPCLRSGNKRSHDSIESGNLLKLAHLVGEIDYVCREMGAPCVLVLPDDWNRQLSKSAVISRIERALGWSPRSHDADAVGMGLAAMGML